MSRLPNALQAWPSAAFAQTLKDELKQLASGVLPLHLGLTEGGIVDDSDLEITILNTGDDERAILAKAGCFFTEVVGGCNCHDDPYTKHAYCELLVRIDKASAEAKFTALSD